MSEVSEQELLARLRNMNAESEKFIAEQHKFAAEQHKLIREGEKYRAEEMKLWRDWRLAPWLVITSLVASIIGGLVARLVH